MAVMDGALHLTGIPIMVMKDGMVNMVIMVMAYTTMVMENMEIGDMIGKDKKIIF
jgi:hypothetical protein